MTQASYTSGLLFTKAHKVVRNRIQAVLAAYDLTPSHWFILGATMRSGEGVRLATVAKEMDVKAPLVTMLANELIEKDLLVRVPHHTDGRAKLLVATNKGKKISERVEAELIAEIADLMRGISSEDAEAFQRTLQAILTNAQCADQI